MKKIVLIAACVATLSAYALPTYEPFTEYSTQVLANPTNAVDLCTSGFTLPSGESWGNWNFSAKAMASGPKAGVDILVTNLGAASPFTQTALGGLLPSTFPGFPSGSTNAITIVAVNPAQTGSTANTVGNSAILQFVSPVARPASGTQTLYVSYLISFAAKGALGAGNDGRFLDFVASTNLVEPDTHYPYWYNLFNFTNNVILCQYCGHGIIQNTTSAAFFGPCDASVGKEFTNSAYQVAMNPANAPAAPSFIVGQYTFTATGSGLKDTNAVWVNPSTSSFGGATPPANPQVDIMPFNMDNIAGIVLEDRVLSGAAGGVPTNWIANMLVGTTWSYVTGGPEFTTQPTANVYTNLGATVTLTGAATAAGQSVTYQWVRVGSGGSTTNINNVSGGAGGNALVSGATTTNLTLTGLSAGDFGSYELIATASGTSYTLASSVATITSDPLITVQPQNTSTAPGATAMFSISASTQYPSLTYQWQLNGAALQNGTQGDGSMVSGATSSALTIANVQNDEFNTTITCAVTNGVNAGEISSGATLSLADPAVTTQPQSQTANYGQTVTLSAVAQTAHAPLRYAWYFGSTMLANGTQPDHSTVTGATGSASSGSTITLTLGGVTYLEAGNYTLYLTNNVSGTATTTAATVTIYDPAIYTEPPSTVNVALNGTTSFSVSGNGTGVTYQWYGPSGQLNNAGEYSGVTTSTLTITGAQLSDAGSYYVTLTDANPPGTSSNSTPVNVVVSSPITGITVAPAALTQQVGTHLAISGTIAGGSPSVSYWWTKNGVGLTDGQQTDGSYVFGSAGTTPAPGAVSLVLSNLQTLDSATYTLVGSNAAGTVTASPGCVVSVTAGILPLASSNIIVSRVGDGAQPLSGTTGNTLYLDQYTTNGTYVDTIMVPDSGQNQLIVPGAGTDGMNESFITLSSNGNYINFAGYFQTYPSANVTVTGTGGIRSIGAVNALGVYVLAYTNYGLYSGGLGFIRDAYSTDGLTNFWTTGAAGSGAVKYVNAGPLGASYATGNGIPALGGAGIVSGDITLGLYGSNLFFTDNNLTVNDTNVLGISPVNYAKGIDIFPGAAPISSGASQTNLVYMSQPADIAISPDQMTMYIADSDMCSQSQGTGNGGIQRWDFSNGTWNYSYNLYDPSGIGTNGFRGLTAYFPPGSTGLNGQTANPGAVIYATTSEISSNRLVQFVDNGGISISLSMGASANSGAGNTPTVTVLATMGSNQFFRGVRFGPAVIPIAVTVSPSPVNTYVGQNVILTGTVSGDGPLTFQWYTNNGVTSGAIPGATTTTLTLNSITAAQSGTYTLTAVNPIQTNSASSVVTVSSGPPLLLSGAQSLVETIGDHTAFSVDVTGTLPLYYQWYQNGTNIPGATGSALILTNIVVTNSGTYSVVYSNMFGTNTNSATLTVTATHQLLGANNLIVARVGDGAQALSDTTGNTLYLDQLTTAGVYSNTIMIPDNAAANLIISGGPVNGPIEAVLNLAANDYYLNFIGYDTNYPNSSSPAWVTVGSAPPAGSVFRSIGAINAFGYFTMAQINQTAFALSPYAVDSAVSLDGVTAFWATGDASAGGLKYLTQATAGSGGGNIPLAGANGVGPRVVQIVAGNVVYSDPTASPPGILAYSGEPVTATTSPATSVIADPAGNPNDFAVSPDTTQFPPSTSTVYLADSSSISGGGGIQRYDWNGSGYSLSYTLGTGAGSTVGASCLTVDFSAQTTWGAGVNGAIIYATTAGASSNQVIKIIDNGAGSAASVLKQATANELLRGIRFSPAVQPLQILTNPASQVVDVGDDVNFTVAAVGTGPLTFQWYTNGGAIPGATSTELLLTNVQLTAAGTYTVSVFNPTNGSVTSAPATLTVNNFSTNDNLVAWYRFNDGSGLSAADSSPYGNTATLQGFPNDNSEWMAGLGGDFALNYANADSNADNVVIAPDAPQLAFTNNLQFTLACWIKNAPVIETNAAGFDGSLITKGYGNGGEQFDLDIYGGYLRFFVRNSGGTVTPINATTSHPTNVWEHIAATFDGNAGVMSLYTNGQRVGTASAPNSLLYTTLPVTVGNRTSANGSAYNLPYYGEMQDVRIYNVALSQADIATLYSDLAPPSAPPSFPVNVPGTFVGSGQFQLTLSGTPGSQFRLWTTADTNAFVGALGTANGVATLTSVTNTWTLVTNGTFGGTGTNVVTDLHATNTSQVYMMTQP